jgi:hypothetical protein
MEPILYSLMLILNENHNKMVTKGNSSLNDPSSKRGTLFVNLIRMTTTINYEKRTVSVLYLFNLSSHYMSKPAYFIGVLKPTEIQKFLKDHSDYLDTMEFLFPKGSPFTNKSVQDFLDENKVQYSYVGKKEIPLLPRISTLYMKRMSEINSEKNTSLELDYLYDLQDFWNKTTSLVTHNLGSAKLTSETAISNKLKKELFKRLEKFDSFRMLENKTNYIYLLVIVKRYLRSKAPETSLVLLNANNGEIVHMKQFIGYKNDNMVLKFFKKYPFKDENHNFILLPKGTFEFVDDFDEYCARHNIMHNTYSNLFDNEVNDYMWAASKIVQNYIRDSSNQLVPFIEPYNKDAKKNFIDHWNNHIVYMFDAQVLLSIQSNKVEA